MSHPATPGPRIARLAGFSLIELLVAMGIGLVVTLAITIVSVRSEGSKRSTTSVNDIEQAGAYATYMLDRSLRDAGSGYSQSWSSMYGCLLNASYSGTQLLPATIPASTLAFSNVKTTTLPTRLAPVIIGKSLANVTSPSAQTRGDVLMVQGGSAGVAESPMQVTPKSVTTSQLMLSNTLGLQSQNIVLVADPSVTGGCLIEEVDPSVGTVAQVVPFSGNYYTSAGSTVSLTAFVPSSTSVLAQLGVESTNPPSFQMFGVGPNNALYNYDLLQIGGNELPVADGVVEMRAIYGLDTGSPPHGVVDSWTDATGNYAATNLLNGSATSQTLLRQIVAVRVGFFMRTSLQERAPTNVNNPEGFLLANNTVLTLFADAVNSAGISLAQTRTLTGTDLYYRWRSVEVTVPILNVLMAPQS
jgi:type IV pilus assembly protein PilW